MAILRKKRSLALLVAGIAILVSVFAWGQTSGVLYVVNDMVGIGTNTPLHKLFVTGDSVDTSTVQMQVRNTSATRTGRQLLGLVNNGPPQIAFTDTSLPRTWLLSNSGGGNFIIKLGGFAGNNFLMDTAGNITITGTLTQSSSRDVKHEFGDVDTREVLDKVVAMPLSTWKYKLDDGNVTHMGPMAEDFYEAFGLGQNDKGITSVDTAGVAFASIQGLYRLNEEKEQKIRNLERQLAEVQEALAALQASSSRQ